MKQPNHPQWNLSTQCKRTYQRNMAFIISLLFATLFLVGIVNYIGHSKVLAQTAPNTPLNAQLFASEWRTWQVLPDEYKEKIDPRILAELQGEIIPSHLGGRDGAFVPPSDRHPLARTRFLVYLRDQPDVAQALQGQIFASAVARRQTVFQTLIQEAEQSQAGVRQQLNENRNAGDVGSYQSFHIVNAIAVEGGLATIVDLARRYDVVRITANYPLVPLWESDGSRQKSFAPDMLLSGAKSLSMAADDYSARLGPLLDPSLESLQQLPGLDPDQPTNWNIELVGAKRVWREFNIRGEGAVVAGFDTGVGFTHPALVDSYRGNQGGTYDHNYNWFEPDSKLYPDGNLGPSASGEPRDCDRFSTHGTHTMGSMIGSEVLNGSVSATQIGMAPNARWIAVPGICGTTMPGGIGDDIGGLKAFQWLLCPTDLSGDLRSADCSKAPDVVNNSWGSANPVNDVFRPAIQALRAAGIAPVFAAGNPSASAGSIGSPANAPEAITVGATDIQDRVASFSGRGPSFYEGEQKPELSAPGVDVRSSVSRDEYYSYSGTSMAAPHVAGLVALLVSADLLDGVRDFNIDEIERFMQLTALDLGEPGADDDYGSGRIDAYEAVRWAISSGDLRGTLRDSANDQPIANASVTGINHSSETRFAAKTAANGIYSITVPAGNYNVTAVAWGYESSTFHSQTVFVNSLSTADLQLTPLPTALLNGLLRTGEVPAGRVALLPTQGSAVVDATVRVLENPAISSQTDASGAFTLTLPIGKHILQFEAANHRTFTESITIDGNNLSMDFEMEAAPTILLVDADAHFGWFSGWPVAPIFQQALRKEGYTHDLWRIEQTDFIDTKVLKDGKVAHGIPSVETLGKYNVVIWMHSGCGGFLCFVGGTPATLGAEEKLIAYLEQGGRLILSGQNISAWDSPDSILLDKYLHVKHVETSAAGEGDKVTGQDFLDDLELTITNAAVYGHSNGVLFLSPDSVRPNEINNTTTPILTYENGAAAALAVGPCTESYRAIFFAVGYENMGPRALERSPDFSIAMDRSIQWLLQERGINDVNISLQAASLQTEEQGKSVHYPIRIVNRGTNAVALQLQLTNAKWRTSVFPNHSQEETEVTNRKKPLSLDSPLMLSPCEQRSIDVVVEIPKTAENGLEDQLIINASIDGAPNNEPQEPTTVITTTTIAFANWTVAEPMPTSRSRMGVTAIADTNQLYAIGGWQNPESYEDFFSSDRTSAANERYDACTREWTQLASLPETLTNVAAATIEDQIYAIGTILSVSTANAGLAQKSHLYRYDPTTDSWHKEADLPVPLTAMALAASSGKLYTFGGWDGAEESIQTFEYDPQADSWTEKAPMPTEGRRYAAAAPLNGKIYVVGGWPDLTTVEVYDPQSDSWTSAAALHTGRQSPGLTAGPDGYLYVVGGAEIWNGLDSVERYDPQADRWSTVATLNDGNRAGTGAAYVAGQLYAIGGNTTVHASEALRLASSFCLSQKSTAWVETSPGDTIQYTLQIYPDQAHDLAAKLIDPLPAQTKFGQFTTNSASVAYIPDANRVEWNGTLPVGTQPISFTYTVLVEDAEWEEGTPIVSRATFEATGLTGGQSTTFERSVTNRIVRPDFANSTLITNQSTAIYGDVITYTVNIESTSVAGGTVTLIDHLPPGLVYLPDSLVYNNGEATYSATDHTVRWRGSVRSDDTVYVNNGPDFIWRDSDTKDSGKGLSFDVDFEWVDISKSGEFIASGIINSQCDLPIGFPFPYFGQLETTFCASTNGVIWFDSEQYVSYSNSCPVENGYNPGVIAAIWDLFNINDGVYYQTLGEAPNRRLVVQWTDAEYFLLFKQGFANFQLILYESGLIKVQILETGAESGRYSSTGLVSQDGTQGVTYACDRAESLSEDLAVLFVPPNGGVGGANEQISYAVTVSDEVAINAVLTNTVTIQGANSIYTRTAQTTFNTIDLALSDLQLSQSQFNIGDSIHYRFTLHNDGLLKAANATITLPLPEPLTFVEGSLTCSNGECRHSAGTIRWHGTIDPERDTLVEFEATLSSPLTDQTIVQSRAILDDGHGDIYSLEADFMARSSNLTDSIVQLPLPFAEPGSGALVEIFVHNTGNVATNATVRLTLPKGLSYQPGSLLCGSGTCTDEGGQIEWVGIVEPRVVIPIRFVVTTATDSTYGDRFVSKVFVTDGNRQEEIAFDMVLTVAQNTRIPLMFAPPQKQHLYLPFIGGG